MSGREVDKTPSLLYVPMQWQPQEHEALCAYLENAAE